MILLLPVTYNWYSLIESDSWDEYGGPVALYFNRSLNMVLMYSVIDGICLCQVL